VAFLIEYAKSDPKTKAETDCTEKSKGNEAKRTECIDKARVDFRADVVRFQQPEKGPCTVVFYKRMDNSLTEVYRGLVTLTEQPPDKVRAQFASGKGARPLFKGAPEGVILVPDDYSIEINDPQLGKLYYTAKVGLVTDDN
jgi:hypothetical protein